MHTKNVLNVSSSSHLSRSSIAVSEFQGAFNFGISVFRILLVTETPYLGANSLSKGFVTAAKRIHFGWVSWPVGGRSSSVSPKRSNKLVTYSHFCSKNIEIHKKSPCCFIISGFILPPHFSSWVL